MCMTCQVAVALDERGGLVDLLPCGQLSGPIPRSAGGAEAVLSDPRKQGDAGRLRDKIKERRPHALVVGGAGLMGPLGWGFEVC